MEDRSSPGVNNPQFAREMLRSRIAGMSGIGKEGYTDAQLDALLECARGDGEYPPWIPEHVIAAAEAVAQAHLRNTKGGPRG